MSRSWYAARDASGRGEVVVASGDVVIDFDTTAVPEDRPPVFGFAKPASPEQGSRHGVFRFDQQRERVVDYFQKAPVEQLVREGLIEGSGDCALDRLHERIVRGRLVEAYFRRGK